MESMTTWLATIGILAAVTIFDLTLGVIVASLLITTVASLTATQKDGTVII